jgi:hypothetical protein
MRKLEQTKLHNPPLSRGNCYATVIACFMDLSCPEDVLQIQDIYDKVEDWNAVLLEWVHEKGWELGSLQAHQYDNIHYLVSGVSPRNPEVMHICIYKNGELWHDPHPDKTGILTEKYFQYLEKKLKTCFKCKKTKNIDDFYKHKETSDKRLGKCKECTKTDSKNQTCINTSTPEGLEKERERHREKYKRLNYLASQELWDKDKPWKKTSTYKGLSKRLNLEKGYEAHHWSYSDESLSDIFVLKCSPHKVLHTHLKLDIERRLFYLADGTYLDSKEKHVEFINSLGIVIYN